MAETPIAQNNKAVKFRGTPEREPAGVTDTAPMKAKKPSRGLRKSAKGAMKRGMISEKAAKRHLSNY